MKKTITTIDITYRDTTSPVIIGRGILSSFGKELKKRFHGNTVVLISDLTVEKIYGKTLLDSCDTENFKVHELKLDITNNGKNLSTVEKIYSFFNEIELNGSFAVVLLGGNVLIDTAGFAAATYFRGLKYYVVSTTLLSQTDGAIGGALGVHYKNMTNFVGVRELPELVMCDIDVFKTLPLAELRVGIAEIIKQAAVVDKKMFEWLELQNESILNNLLELHSLTIEVIKVKSKLVETGDDRYLNFGHTIGHALENLMKHKNIRHGEAIAIGMCGEISLSEISNNLPIGTTKRMEKILLKFGLPIKFPNFIISEYKSKEDFCENLYDMIWRDKKVFNDKLHWRVPVKDIGQAGDIYVTKEEIISELLRLCEDKLEGEIL